ncbi:MAG: carboxypeptidase regulatory-like domain-containing protein [Bacteroidales bacterium]|nr:carboxypeptidase regulatory-like domain-containing protein [Bacteroidales bacterium]
MRHSLILSVVLLGTLLFSLNSCDKSDTNSSDDGFRSKYTNTTISGIVYDENHWPVQGATITAHGHTQTTDANGVFTFPKISVPIYRCYVVVNYNDQYFEIMRSSKPVEHGVTRLDAHLLSKAMGNSFYFNAGSNYTANLSDGSTISFYSSTQFVDETGNPYNGGVSLYTYVLDASANGYSRYAPAGDQVGLDQNTETYLDAYTGTMVEIRGDNGEKLQLASGTTPVDIAQQIPAALVGGSPTTVPLYYASSSSGYNKRDGGAVKNGGTYETAVGHFSYWSTQVETYGYGNLKCRVIDASGNIIQGVRVQVGKAYGITGEDGTFDLRVPAGINFNVAILPLDFHTFSVTSAQSSMANDEYRFVELQLPADLDYLQGRLVDCNNNPVEGQVTLSWSNNVSTVYTQNGSFRLPTIYSGFSYYLTIHTAEKDTSFSVELSTGSTNIGNVELCDEMEFEYQNIINIHLMSGELITLSKFYNSYTAYLITDTVSGESRISGYADGVDGNFSFEVLGSGTGTYTIDMDMLDAINNFTLYTMNFGYITITHGTIEITRFDEVGGMVEATIHGVTSNEETIDATIKLKRTVDYHTGN